MSFQFGEIVYPSSRAFLGDEEYESIETAERRAKFTVEWTEEVPTVIEKIIFIEGDVLSDFTKICLINDWEKVCIIESCKSVREPTTIYKNEAMYICVIGVEVDLPCSAEFIESIQEILKISKLIIAVTTDHISHFKGDDELESPSFIRVLCTKGAKNDCIQNIPFLTQPNFISGPASGVVSFAEVANIPAILYILYTDTFVLDSQGAVPLTKLFSSILGYSLPEYLPSGKDYFSKENLYM